MEVAAMYLEVRKDGNVFVFLNPAMVAWLSYANQLVIETVYGRHVFKDVNKELWSKISGELRPNAAIYVDLDKKRVAGVGL